MDIQERPFQAQDIASRADIENLEEYESNIQQYRDRDFTFIPMPQDDCYYDTSSETVHDIQTGQYIDREAHLWQAIQRLEDHLFLLIDLEPEFYLVDLKDPYVRGVFDSHPDGPVPNNAGLFTPDEVKEEFPELASRELRDYSERYMIITQADLNKRRVREMLYIIIGGLSSELSSRIESEHPDSRSLFKYLRPGTIGRWEKENLKDLNLHIAEHMNLLDMMQAIQGSDSEFVESCGFDSKNDVTTLNSINSIRNRVMHANRSLVYDQDDISDVVEAVEEAQRILTNMS